MASGRVHRRDRPYRGLALGVVGLGLLLLSFVVYILLRPVYWKLYADVIHSYKSEPVETTPDGGPSKAPELPGGRKTGPAVVVSGESKAGPDPTKAKPAAELKEDEKELDDWWEKQKKGGEAKDHPKDVDTQEKQEEDAPKAVTTKETEADIIAKYNHTLSSKLVQDLATDNYLMVTWANHHYTQFALTWVHHVQQIKMSAFIVGAMDEEILKELAKRRIHTFSMQSGLPTGDFGWGSHHFAKMGRKKINLVAMFLRLGVQVIISDVDVLWLRDPLRFFKRFPDADILTSSDHLGTTVKTGEELERYPEAGSAFNIGIMLFRNRSLDFVDEWVEIIEADDKIWDQNAFNDLVRRGQKILPDDPNHYFVGDNGKLKVGVLPVSTFCSGHTYFTQNMPGTMGITPYAVHATFQFSGTDGKRHRFRERRLWQDPPEYYQPPGGLVAFDPDIPEALLKNGGPNNGKMEVSNTIGHFALVNHQLKQIRAGLALATVLGRTLVLPPIWCGQDRWWAPHSGVIPGSDFKLPFLCPADHVLDLENGMAASWPDNEFGPHIPYREYSMLNNSAMPDSAKASTVTVSTCKKGAMGCADGSSPATVERNHVTLLEHLDSERIKMALSSVGSVMVLKFKNVFDAFGNFTQPEDFQKFYKRTMHYGAVWCCVDAHPGHMHYDMWWDMPGHTDRFGRTWTKWEPKTGP